MLYKILSLSVLVSASITDCSKGKSLFKVTGLGFWPDPAERNSNSTVSFAYTVPEPGFTGGTASYTATYNFIPLMPTVEDLCKSVRCPILPGPTNMSTSSVFPNLNGNLDARIEWKSLSGEQLLCALIKTKVV